VVAKFDTRRRILIPVTAGSSPAALTNSSRGLGREGAGSHKAGVSGSTPVPATISGGSGTGKTGCVRRSQNWSTCSSSSLLRTSASPCNDRTCVCRTLRIRLCLMGGRSPEDACWLQFRHRHAATVRNGLPLPVPIAADYEMGGHSISPDFVQWQDARLWTGRRGVRFSQSGPDTGLVQW
jgi:hypothetical protein